MGHQRIQFQTRGFTCGFGAIIRGLEGTEREYRANPLSGPHVSFGCTPSSFMLIVADFGHEGLVRIRSHEKLPTIGMSYWCDIEASPFHFCIFCERAVACMQSGTLAPYVQ